MALCLSTCSPKWATISRGTHKLYTWFYYCFLFAIGTMRFLKRTFSCYSFATRCPGTCFRIIFLGSAQFNIIVFRKSNSLLNRFTSTFYTFYRYRTRVFVGRIKCNVLRVLNVAATHCHAAAFRQGCFVHHLFARYL